MAVIPPLSKSLQYVASYFLLWGNGKSNISAYLV